MYSPSKYKGLKVGAIFTTCSLLLTPTFIVPFLSILPGVAFEILSAAIVSNAPYSNVGKMTIVLLSLILIVLLFFVFRRIKKQALIGYQMSGVGLAGVMTLLYLIIHPLVFYIYWGVALDFRSDGQLMFASVDSFPLSSFSFVLIGGVIDWIKNRAANSNLPEGGL
jgi:hypothetical protein